MSMDGDPLEELRWRAEILEALYWMRGEGLAEAVDPPSLARFLASDVSTIAQHMRLLCSDGFLQANGDAFGLTPLGLKEGGRSFHDAFSDYIRPAHGECGASCWCRDPKHAGEPCPSEVGARR
jgi:hypothetical protein